MSENITIQTLFGTFNTKELKEIRGVITEMVNCLYKIKDERDMMKEIVDQAYDKYKIPKKMLKKMANVEFKQSFLTEVSEYKEFEALFEVINEIK